MNQVAEGNKDAGFAVSLLYSLYNRTEEEINNIDEARIDMLLENAPRIMRMLQPRL